MINVAEKFYNIFLPKYQHDIKDKNSTEFININKYLKFRYIIVFCMNIYFIIQIKNINKNLHNIKSYFQENDIKFKDFNLIIVNIIMSYCVFNACIYYIYRRYNNYLKKFKSFEIYSQTEQIRNNFVRKIMNNNDVNLYRSKYLFLNNSYLNIDISENNYLNILSLSLFTLFYCYITTSPYIVFNISGNINHKFLLTSSKIIKNSLFITIFNSLCLIHFLLLNIKDIVKIKHHLIGFNFTILLFYFAIFNANITNICYVLFTNVEYVTIIGILFMISTIIFIQISEYENDLFYKIYVENPINILIRIINEKNNVV